MVISADVTVNAGDDPERAIIWKRFDDQPVDTAFAVDKFNFDAPDFLTQSSVYGIFYGYQRTDRPDKIMIARFAIGAKLEITYVKEITKPNGSNKLLSLSITPGWMQLEYRQKSVEGADGTWS